MPGLILLLLFGLLLSYTLRKDPADVFPPYVFTFLTGLYLLGILKKSHHAFFLSLFAFAAIWIFFIIRGKKILPSIKDIKSLPLPTGFLFYLAVCLIMLYAYHTHFVLGWDDFHYNATFPKDMYYYGTMPVGAASTTWYKDYLPTLQLFYYWGFQSVRKFSEPLMFQYKIVLIYTCMLPFFKLMNNTHGLKKAAAGVIAVILPYISLIEILDGLSMDTIMALLFGYAVIMIVFEKKRDWFCFYRILSCLTVLVLIKTIAAMFAGICMGIWLFTGLLRMKGSDPGARIKRAGIYIMSCLTVFAAWSSWKVFCLRNGNASYLTKKNAAFFDSTGKVTLPSYGISTIHAIIRSLFTMKLNFGMFSLTVAGMIIFTAVLCTIMIKKKKFGRTDAACYTVLFAGLAVYTAFLCYTYLFIFEEWEAESLSSLDRYLGTYVLTVMFIVLFHFISSESGSTLMVCGAALILLCTLNYPRIYNALVPSAYMETRKDIYTDRMRAEKETSGVEHLDLEHRKMLIVNNSTNDVYSRSLAYDMIPVVTEEFVTTDINEDELADELSAKIKDRDIYYVYFTSQEGTDPSFHGFDSIAEDGMAKCHVLYYYDGETEKLKEVKAQ